MNVLSKKVYDVIAILARFIIPTLSAAYVGLAQIWGWPYAEAIAATASVIAAALNGFLKIDLNNLVTAGDITVEETEVENPVEDATDEEGLG